MIRFVFGMDCPATRNACVRKDVGVSIFELTSEMIPYIRGFLTPF